MLRLGNVYLDTLELRSKAIPWAEDLARRTGCAVRTGVLLLDDVVIIHHEPRPDGSRQMPEVGIVIPAHASALGKAILAFDDDAAARLLAMSPLRSMTGETITSPDDLKEQLAEIGSTGLANEQDEAVLGECARRPGLRLVRLCRRRHRRRGPVGRLGGRPRGARHGSRDRASPFPGARRGVVAPRSTS